MTGNLKNRLVSYCSYVQVKLDTDCESTLKDFARNRAHVLFLRDSNAIKYNRIYPGITHSSKPALPQPSPQPSLQPLRLPPNPPPFFAMTLSAERGSDGGPVTKRLRSGRRYGGRTHLGTGWGSTGRRKRGTWAAAEGRPHNVPRPRPRSPMKQCSRPPRPRPRPPL